MFEIQNISKRFSENFVLRNFSFQISRGDKVNITGRSGIGKTTLFRLLLGFEKPDSGTISFEGNVLTDTSVWELRRRIAYVSQDLNIGSGKVQNLFDETMSFRANLKYKEEAAIEIPQLFDYFELQDSLLQKDIETLSGGEKQRAAIVNALLLKRDIFFLDEISSALDKPLRIKVLDYFLLNPDFTVLSISHDNYLPSVVEIKALKLN
jgi:putative ABC transport system ATP-binding protein